VCRDDFCKLRRRRPCAARTVEERGHIRGVLNLIVFLFAEPFPPFLKACGVDSRTGARNLQGYFHLRGHALTADCEGQSF